MELEWGDSSAELEDGEPRQPGSGWDTADAYGTPPVKNFLQRAKRSNSGSREKEKKKLPWKKMETKGAKGARSVEQKTHKVQRERMIQQERAFKDLDTTMTVLGIEALMQAQASLDSGDSMKFSTTLSPEPSTPIGLNGPLDLNGSPSLAPQERAGVRVQPDTPRLQQPVLAAPADSPSDSPEAAAAPMPRSISDGLVLRLALPSQDTSSSRGSSAEGGDGAVAAPAGRPLRHSSSPAMIGATRGRSRFRLDLQEGGEEGEPDTGFLQNERQEWRDTLVTLEGVLEGRLAVEDTAGILQDTLSQARDLARDLAEFVEDSSLETWSDRDSHLSYLNTCINKARGIMREVPPGDSAGLQTVAAAMWPHIVQLCAALCESIGAGLGSLTPNNDELRLASRLARGAVVASEHICNKLRDKNITLPHLDAEDVLAAHVEGMVGHLAAHARSTQDDLLSGAVLDAGRQLAAAPAAGLSAHQISSSVRLLPHLWRMSADLVKQAGDVWPARHLLMQREVCRCLNEAAEAATAMLQPDVSALSVASDDDSEEPSSSCSSSRQLRPQGYGTMGVWGEGLRCADGPRVSDAEVQSHSWVPQLLNHLLFRSQEAHKRLQDMLTNRDKAGLLSGEQEDELLDMMDAMHDVWFSVVLGNTQRVAGLCAGQEGLACWALERLKGMAEEALRLVQEYDKSCLGLQYILRGTDDKPMVNKTVGRLFATLKHSTDDVINSYTRLRRLLKLRRADQPPAQPPAAAAAAVGRSRTGPRPVQRVSQPWAAAPPPGQVQRAAPSTTAPANPPVTPISVPTPAGPSAAPATPATPAQAQKPTLSPFNSLASQKWPSPPSQEPAQPAGPGKEWMLQPGPIPGSERLAEQPGGNARAADPTPSDLSAKPPRSEHPVPPICPPAPMPTSRAPGGPPQQAIPPTSSQRSTQATHASTPFAPTDKAQSSSHSTAASASATAAAAATATAASKAATAATPAAAPTASKAATAAIPAAAPAASKAATAATPAAAPAASKAATAATLAAAPAAAPAASTTAAELVAIAGPRSWASLLRKGQPSSTATQAKQAPPTPAAPAPAASTPSTSAAASSAAATSSRLHPQQHQQQQERQQPDSQPPLQLQPSGQPPDQRRPPDKVQPPDKAQPPDQRQPPDAQPAVRPAQPLPRTPSASFLAGVTPTPGPLPTPPTQTPAAAPGARSTQPPAAGPHPSTTAQHKVAIHDRHPSLTSLPDVPLNQAPVTSTTSQQPPPAAAVTAETDAPAASSAAAAVPGAAAAAGAGGAGAGSGSTTVPAASTNGVSAVAGATHHGQAGTVSTGPGQAVKANGEVANGELGSGQVSQATSTAGSHDGDGHVSLSDPNLTSPFAQTQHPRHKRSNSQLLTSLEPAFSRSFSSVLRGQTGPAAAQPPPADPGRQPPGGRTPAAELSPLGPEQGTAWVIGPQRPTRPAAQPGPQDLSQTSGAEGDIDSDTTTGTTTTEEAPLTKRPEASSGSGSSPEEDGWLVVTARRDTTHRHGAASAGAGRGRPLPGNVPAATAFVVSSQSGGGRHPGGAGKGQAAPSGPSFKPSTPAGITPDPRAAGHGGHGHLAVPKLQPPHMNQEREQSGASHRGANGAMPASSNPAGPLNTTPAAAGAGGSAAGTAAAAAHSRRPTLDQLFQPAASTKQAAGPVAPAAAASTPAPSHTTSCQPSAAAAAAATHQPPPTTQREDSVTIYGAPSTLALWLKQGRSAAPTPPAIQAPSNPKDPDVTSHPISPRSPTSGNSTLQPSPPPFRPTPPRHRPSKSTSALLTNTWELSIRAFTRTTTSVRRGDPAAAPNGTLANGTLAHGAWANGTHGNGTAAAAAGSHLPTIVDLSGWDSGRTCGGALEPLEAGGGRPAQPGSPTAGLVSSNSQLSSMGAWSLSAEDEFWSIKWRDLQPSLVKKLGSGSYGQVWQGLYHGADVAIKVINIDFDSGLGEETVNSFKREVELQRRLSHHPNVVRFIGACCEFPQSLLRHMHDTVIGEQLKGVKLAIVMELCRMGSLFDVIRQARQVHRLLKEGARPNDLKRQLPSGFQFYHDWITRLEVLRGAAAGVHFMHSHRVVHRDLTSYNLLLDYGRPWQVKVADFNLSRMISDGQQLCNSGNPNSPGWQSPELLKGDSYGREADVFSFGVILWEAITLKEPWRDEIEGQAVALYYIMNSVIDGKRLEFPRPEEVSPPCPELEQVIQLAQQCWDHAPSRRPALDEAAARLTSIINAMKERLRRERAAQGGAPGGTGGHGPSTSGTTA